MPSGAVRLSCNSRVARVSFALYVKGKEGKEGKEEEVGKRKCMWRSLSAGRVRLVRGDEMDGRKEMADEGPKEKVQGERKVAGL